MAKVIRRPGPAAARLAAMQKQKDVEVRVGFLESAQYESGVSAAYVAVIQENGVPEKNIPPRPIFAPTVERCSNDWRNMAESGAKAVVAGNQTIKGVMSAIGGHAAAEVQRTIAETVSPALAPETIMNRIRKKAAGLPVGNPTKPLQESGYLFRSVTFDLVKEGS